MVRLQLNAQNHNGEIHTCDECAGVFCEEEERMSVIQRDLADNIRLVESIFQTSCCLIRKHSLTWNSSANMSKATQIVSKDYGEDTSVSGCSPRKLLILDVCVCCWISAVLVCICLLAVDQIRKERAELETRC